MLKELFNQHSPLEVVGFVSLLGGAAVAMWFFLVMFLPSY